MNSIGVVSLFVISCSWAQVPPVTPPVPGAHKFADKNEIQDQEYEFYNYIYLLLLVGSTYPTIPLCGVCK